MTKTEARKVAQRARRYGHFAHGDGMLRVYCPRCGKPVRTYCGHRYRLARKGEPATTNPDVLNGRRAVFERESVVQALDRAMIEHLLDDELCRPN